jgi:alkyl sulfatase BDS1-like metallo-beta-lactamase superfamily hydrolase
MLASFKYIRDLSPAALGAILGLVLSSSTLFAQEHFNPRGNAASTATVALQEALRESLPFEDERDFQEARRGFIAEPASRQILGASGNVVWDLTRYDFLLSGEQWNTIHPSLISSTRCGASTSLT